MFEKILAKVNSDDFLTTVALFGFIAVVYRQVTVDPVAFGEGVAGIFGGHALRSLGNSKEPPKV